jgi:hypothetical protein
MLADEILRYSPELEAGLRQMSALAGHPIAPFIDLGDFGLFLLPDDHYERVRANPKLWPRYCRWIQSRGRDLWLAGLTN